MINLEKVCHSFKSSSIKLKILSNNLDSISTNVYYTIHSLPTSFLSSSFIHNLLILSLVYPSFQRQTVLLFFLHVNLFLLIIFLPNDINHLQENLLCEIIHYLCYSSTLVINPSPFAFFLTINLQSINLHFFKQTSLMLLPMKIHYYLFPQWKLHYLPDHPLFNFHTHLRLKNLHLFK